MFNIDHSHTGAEIWKWILLRREDGADALEGISISTRRTN
jgi:hypothetical protein